MIRGWHLNPKTGEPGQCRAEIACRFGEDHPHFQSEAEARQFFENEMSELTLPDLISRSQEISSWRSRAWEERKLLLEDYLQERSRSHPRLRRKPISVVWRDVVNESPHVLGYADSRTNTIYLSNAAESLEETSSKSLIVHELAHLLERRPLFGRREDHGPEWMGHAESIASNSEILAGMSFPGDAERTPLEKLRRESQKIAARAPKFIGKCPRGHASYANELPQGAPGCEECRRATYDLFSKPSWSPWQPGSQDERDYIEFNLGRIGFGKENRP